MSNLESDVGLNVTWVKTLGQLRALMLNYVLKDKIVI